MPPRPGHQRTSSASARRRRRLTERRATAHRGRLLPRLVLLGVLLSAVVCATLVGPEPAAAAPANTVTRGPADRPRIALTFDDNFYPSRALAVISVLRQYGVRATVFVTGQYVTAYPEISQAIVDGGFEVGDHTMTHPFLARLTWSGMLAEIGGGTRRFSEQTGYATAPLLRPPYGSTSDLVAEAAGAQGFRYVVLWDIDTSDWRGYSAATIRDHVLGNAHNGAIVLMHLAAPNTAEALPSIITSLRARGYELVTVSELLKGGRRFADLDQESEVGRAVVRMNDLGYMAGYSERYFGPSDTITRAQLAKVSVLVVERHSPEVEWSNTPTFVDVPPTWDKDGNPISYPFDYVQEAAAAGLMQGRPRDGADVFEPDRPLSRVQMAQILARMAREMKGYPAFSPPDGSQGPSGLTDVPGYAAADVELVASLGLMKGYGNGLFDPWATAQRGHVALVMTRFMDLPFYQPPAADPAEPAPPAGGSSETTSTAQDTTAPGAQAMTDGDSTGAAPTTEATMTAASVSTAPAP